MCTVYFSFVSPDCTNLSFRLFNLLYIHCDRPIPLTSNKIVDQSLLSFPSSMFSSTCAEEQLVFESNACRFSLVFL